MTIENQNSEIPLWHSKSIEAMLSALETQTSGLSDAQAETRRKQYGPNRLPQVKRRSVWRRFLLQFHNVLIYVLIAAAAITALLQHWIDSGVILGVVLINAIIGFIQEGKAEKALEAIRRLLSQQASVKRNGQLQNLPAEQLVPGDAVMIQSGDKVPADLRLFQVKDLHIEEALLTGESVPVNKTTEQLDANTLLGDRQNMAYSGTLVTYGQGHGIVVSIGDQTEIGRITSLLRHIEKVTTPLLRQMAGFGRLLTYAIGILATLTFAYGVWIVDFTPTAMFLAAVGLTVAAIPEGLPAIMTITLAIGVQRMARRKAIIRRLPAVETLGSVSVICSDKTGTLTRNEMTVQTIVTTEGRFSVSGSGYDFHGQFLENHNEVDIQQKPISRELILGGFLCNDASFIKRKGRWQLNGDPTEGALIALGRKAGLDSEATRYNYPRSDVIPFESENRFMASLHHDHQGHVFTYIKGAPEMILSMASDQHKGNEKVPLDRTYWERTVKEMASHGQRILAFAKKDMARQYTDLVFDDIESDITLLGMVGMIDPPREDAIRAVRSCQKAGIAVKMITGDHAITAAAVGEQMGLSRHEVVITGKEVDRLDDSELATIIARIDIFARTSPEHKLRIVTALQKQKHIVAMTGDGVNDAPALKRADIGIAMGDKGTEVTKESSDMVLTDDNFATIVSAVEEGRTVYDNLIKSIIYILPTSGGEALTIIAAVLLGTALPISAAQILWINMVTTVTLALTLGFEPPEEDIMSRPPRSPDEPILSRFLVWRVVLVSLVLVAGTFGLFWFEQANGASLAHSQTVAVNTLVMFEVFYLFNSRYLHNPVLSRSGFFGNRYILLAIALLIVIQLMFTYLPVMQLLFGTTAIGPYDWSKILAVAISIFFIVEAEKFAIRRLRARALEANSQQT